MLSAQSDLINFLFQNKVNPYRVSRDGWDSTGYWEYDLNEDGTKVRLIGGEPRKFFRPWPNGFPYLEFRRLARKAFPD